MRKRIVMNDHKKYYQILMEFKKTLGVDDEEFAELCGAWYGNCLC